MTREVLKVVPELGVAPGTAAGRAKEAKPLGVTEGVTEGATEGAHRAGAVTRQAVPSLGAPSRAARVETGTGAGPILAQHARAAFASPTRPASSARLRITVAARTRSASR